MGYCQGVQCLGFGDEIWGLWRYRSGRGGFWVLQKESLWLLLGFVKGTSMGLFCSRLWLYGNFMVLCLVTGLLRGPQSLGFWASLAPGLTKWCTRAKLKGQEESQLEAERVFYKAPYGFCKGSVRVDVSRRRFKSSSVGG